MIGINLISRETGSDKVYYFNNGHADVTALLDATTKNIRSQYKYDEFGNITSETYYDSNGVETTDENEIIKSQILYAGYQYDEESKYYNLHARYYDPQTARFLKQDTYRGTVADPLSLNLYTYCHNEPMMYYDPTGHSEKSAVDLIGEIIAAKKIYEEDQDWRDGLWLVDPRRHVRTKAQKKAASSAETARSSMKSTKAYEDSTLRKAIDSYLDKEFGGTMEDVLDLQKTILSYKNLLNRKKHIANQKSRETVEPDSNEGTGNDADSFIEWLKQIEAPCAVAVVAKWRFL